MTRFVTASTNEKKIISVMINLYQVGESSSCIELVIVVIYKF